jgi:ribosome biogenesis GTPase / thiamine phosphate phosphatase
MDELPHVGFNPLVAQAHAAMGEAAGTLARVVEHTRGVSVVHTGSRVLDAHTMPALAREHSIGVGDWVLVHEDAHGQCWIAARLPPYSQLQRIDPSGARQTLVTNVDCAFLVMGLDGDFNPRRLERYLAMAKSAGVLPVVVLTKRDLCADVDARLDELAARIPSSVDRLAVNGTVEVEVEGLKSYLGAGQTAVLLGSSGAGKSTLTNTLMGSAEQRTSPVREDDSHGRHTTTSRQLRQLPTGGCIIDTPGLRGLRLDIDEASLDALFEDIASRAAQCRFRDCTHDSEPGCAVREHVQPDRLANYHKLKREVARDHANALARQATRAKVKTMHRAIRAMQKERGR